MVREVLYRRSFHVDRDLKGMVNLLEMDRASDIRQGNTDGRMFATDGGFEAPRNSLDVPFSGLLEARRNSEVRCEEIPIGYELSRSLTTRRRNEDHFSLNPPMPVSDQEVLKSKGNVANLNLELDCKPQPRAPSVVARLMGLDALPRQEVLQGSHHSSLRRVLKEECISSYNVPSQNEVNVSTENELLVEDYSREKVGYGELSFRNHPQEKQLQEFKREFAARQALQGRPSFSRLNLESLTTQHQREQNSGLDPQMDSEEFLDALDFLNANKDFFVKILNDPNSSFAKHLQQGGGSLTSLEDGTRQHMGGGNHTKSPSEYSVYSSSEVSAEWRKRQDMHPADKARVIGNLRWGRDDEMPGRLRWRGRGGSTMRATGRVGANQVVPTRIVVLKPNLCREPSEKSSTPSSPLLRPDGLLKFRTEGKESVKQEAKLRGNSKNNGGLAREFLREDFKDGPYDARAIAKQIVKHVKEDMSQRSFKEGLHIPDSCRRSPVQKVGGWPANTSHSVDGELSERSTRETGGKFSFSVPSSPRVSKPDREFVSSSFNGRRGSHTEELKKGSYKQPTSAAKSSKEWSKADEEGHQGLSRKERGVKDSKPSKTTYRSNSLKVRETKCEVPRVLPRSLSAPAAPCVENRALEGELKGGYSIERATCSSRAKSSENSVLKERLLSLKDSFSLSKKRGTRKPGPTQGISPVDSSELPARRNLDVDPVDGNEPCNLPPRFLWQAATSSAMREEAKEVKEKLINAVLSESGLRPSGLPQWTSPADLVDTASETSLDKCEQPSPVSVLETPFQEESPSSTGTRQAESNCHDFIGGLSHLKPNCKGLSRRNLHAVFSSQPSSCQSSFNSSTDKSPNTWNLLEAHLESVGICSVACPSGREEELTYIAHVLCLSGLTMNGLVMAHTLSSEHGVNRSIFGRLEAYYDNRCSMEASLVEKCGQTPLNPLSRRLLFDLVDEVIASALKKRLLQPWTMSSNQKVLVCTSKQLVEQIFAHINYHNFVPLEVEEEALEDMASKDLMGEAPWVHSQSDMESVVVELERLLCGDLIRELVHDEFRS